MAYKLNYVFKKFLLLALAITFVISVSYHPSNAGTAHAGLPVVDIPEKVERIINAIGMAIAQKMVDSMVQSTVKWAQSGFDGNPAYATNPKQYFADIADGVAGEYIKGSDLGFLCSPFQAQIRLSLVQQYVEDPKPFQCTLTGINGNIEDFYTDFSRGGWQSWFSMTQNSNNNPYGAYLNAKIELDSRIAEKVGLEKEQLDWNQGFLSWKGDCPADKIVSSEQAAEWQDSEIYNHDGLPYEPGDCLDDNLKIATPGSTIKSQLDKVLPSGMDRLINAQSIDQLVSSFASGLLNRYVFGSQGLFASGSSSSSSGGPSGGNVLDSRLGKIDTDGDEIPEGEDMDKDGALRSSVDICYHGGNAPACITSRNATRSPYLEPLCNSIERATNTLTEFARFMDANAKQMDGGERFQGTIITSILLGPVGAIYGTLLGGGGTVDNFKNEADSTIWHNKAAAVDGSLTSVIRNIQEINIPYFDSTEVVVNRYSFYIDKVSESLIQDKDLDLAKVGSGGGGLENLMKKTAYNLRYMQEVKSRLGQCNLPNMTDLNTIATPPEDTTEGGGGQCSATGEQYAGVLADAMDTVLRERPDVANLPNIESGGRQNARTFLALVEAELVSMGYRAADDVLNGNNNPSTGDIIAVWREGDATMERYDAIIGSASTIGEATQTHFTGFIPLNCTSGGGGNDCGCKDGDGGGAIQPGAEPASLLSDLQAERSKYGTPMTGVEVGKLLNAVAWKNRDAGWKLLGKESGANCPAPGGQRISCDYLIHQGTYYGYDVLIDTEGVSTPSWQGPEDLRTSINNGSRTFVAPVAP